MAKSIADVNSDDIKSLVDLIGPYLTAALDQVPGELVSAGRAVLDQAAIDQLSVWSPLAGELAAAVSTGESGPKRPGRVFNMNGMNSTATARMIDRLNRSQRLVDSFEREQTITTGADTAATPVRPGLSFVSGPARTEVPPRQQVPPTDTSELPFPFNVTLSENPESNVVTDPAQLGISPLGVILAQQEGVPVRETGPDGTTVTVAPNPSGVPSVITSRPGPDNSVQTTVRNPTGTQSSSVSTPRSDGSGIVDTRITNPDGSTLTLESVPRPDGSIGLYSIGSDGTRTPMGNSVPLPDGAGIITEIPGANGITSRAVTDSRGATQFETYTVAPDGKEELVAFSNTTGAQMARRPDGSIEYDNGDGLSGVVIRKPDGSVAVEFKDGSVLTVDAPADGEPELNPLDVAAELVLPGQIELAMDFLNSTIDGAVQHPYINSSGVLASGIFQGLDELGEGLDIKSMNMAQRAALLKELSLDNLKNRTGQPGANLSKWLFTESLEATDEASRLANAGNILSKLGKVGGPLATAGISTYASIDAYNNGEKDLDEAISSGVGATVGGIGGSYAGAALGFAVGGPAGAIVGAMVGGYLGGAIGGWAAEKPFK
ncbi:hypothetical protein JK358_00900 [Nocardia sp. 2]|uniref:Uncharacterized protein n=1 Tax=Nocardia acididurans TaxID=2802282 RepID=A0ABS1LX99_9NOCA|nr:hypothetical protein [Nocardia acididurans]MBL1072947.1 hypothetical protein [Nocardia acididurans]